MIEGRAGSPGAGEYTFEQRGREDVALADADRLVAY